MSYKFFVTVNSFNLKRSARSENLSRVKKLNSEIVFLSKQLTPKLSSEKMRLNYLNLKEQWDDASNPEKNELLKSVVSKILYDRVGDVVNLSVTLRMDDSGGAKE